jgi:hypothetical protein
MNVECRIEREKINRELGKLQNSTFLIQYSLFFKIDKFFS